MSFNPVLALINVLGLWAALALPLLRVAPNRLVSGDPVYLAELLQTPSRGLFPAGWVVLIVAAMVAAIFGSARRWVHWGVVGIAAVWMATLVWLAGHHASATALTESPLARTALGAGFWSLIALSWLLCLDAVERLQIGFLPRMALVASVAVPMASVVGLGYCDELSILKEYANRSDVFASAVLRHLQIVATAIVPTVLLGLPLAWAAYRHARVHSLLFPFLNLVQTIPSIALFGLFMAPLAWMAASYPLLGRAGIRGVGLAPAVLALFLYSLLPVVRSAVAGLQQVPGAVKTAARGMGMGAGAIFWRVEVPLALPVLLLGLRAAVVQTIGLAAVTALVGAGGLGSLMFEGLFSGANELVLLGVVPIVVLAVLADGMFKALSAVLKGPVA